MDGISNPDEGNFVHAAAPATGGGGAVSHSSRTEGGGSALPPSPATPVPVTISDISVTVMLIDSVGAGIAGSEVEYEQGGWIAFGVTDANGTARRSLAPGIYSFRVVYEDCVCSTSHNITENPGVLFQTDNATVLLKTAEGVGLAGGAVEFFNGNWTGFGTTGNDGSTSCEMLPGTYPVRVHYEGAVLETILTTSIPLECTTTSVTLHFPGTIRFNAGGWRAFTQPSMELLPGTYACTFDGYETNISVNDSAVEKSIFILLLEGQAAPGLSGGTGQYSLSGSWHTLPGSTNASGVLVGAPDGSPGRLNVRMTYANATLQKRQDIRTNPVFRFATTTVTVRSADSEGRGIGNDDVLYAADGWHTFGTTGADGNTTLELLPKTYTFRLISNGTTRNQVQDIGIDPLVIFTTNTTTVRFADSAGNGIAGGGVEYYTSGWKSFGTTGIDGNVTRELLPKSYTFRITSDGATISKVQDIAADPVVEFRTNLTTVRFETPDGTGIPDATVEYNAGGWKTFGTTGADGNTTKELLPKSYQFRITHEGMTETTTQDISTNPLVVFKTNVTTVTFTDSLENGIAGGVIEYNAGGWKPFGITAVDGNTTKDLIPKSYTFRITCDGATISKVQDVAADPVVEFRTNLTTVRFETPDGTGIPDATVEYNAGGWKPFGTTGADGNATKELLPKSYTFRISYEGMTKSTTQDIGIDPCVVFTTNTTTVRFTDSLGEGIAGGVIEYNAGGWKPFGITAADGNSTKELIPKSYTFRLTCDGVAITRTQDTAIDPLVVFTTTLATVSFTDSAGNGIPDATVEYYAGGWKPFGATGIDGNATKELLPKSYRFRISYDGVIQEREQDIGVDPVVGFTTTGAIVSFIGSTGNGIPGTAIEYYSEGWNTFGTTGADGNATKELLPQSYRFRISYDDVMQEREQNIGVDPVVRYRTSLATVRFLASDDSGISGGIAEYDAGGWKPFGTTGMDGDTTRELLPIVYTFRLTYGSSTPEEQVQDIGADTVVVFRAEPVVIRLIDSGGAGLPGGIVRYKDSGWNDFGTTGADGYITADLPPQEYEIEMGYNGHTLTETLTDPTSPLIIQTGSVHSVLGTCTNYQVTNGWEDFTQDIELLPGEVKFKFSDINGAKKYTVTAGEVTEIH